MTKSIEQPATHTCPYSWRGLLPMACMLILLLRMQPLLPNPYSPERDVYIGNAVLLGLAVAAGWSAVRSRHRGDRILGGGLGGVAILMIGIIVWDCF